MLYATRNCHDGFWRTLPDVVMDEGHPEDVDTDQEDHAVDEIRYACMSRPRPTAPKEARRIGKGPKPWTIEWLIQNKFETSTGAPRVSRYNIDS